MERPNGISKLARQRITLLCGYVILLLPFVVLGAIDALKSNSNSPIDWVPSTFPPRAEYDAFVEKFGPGDALIVSWEGCSIENENLDPLLVALRKSPTFRTKSGATLFTSVSCGRELLLKLLSGPQPLDLSEAIKRLQGVLIGSDEKTTCLILNFSPLALKHRADVVEKVKKEVQLHCSVRPDDIKLAGPVVDGMEADRASQRSLDQLAIPSTIIVLVVACFSLRSWKAGLLVFGLAVYAQATTLACIHFGGEKMSALLIVLPPLIQVLAVAGGVHLANYFFESLPRDGHELAPWKAVSAGLVPCLLSFGTTAVGIGSLINSELSPIRMFALYGAIGVVLTATFLLVLFPSLLTLLTPFKNSSSLDRTTRTEAGEPNSAIWNWATAAQSFAWPLVLIVGIGGTAALGYWTRELRTSVHITTLFPQESRILQDYRWLEEHIGSLVPIEVVVSWPRNSKSTFDEELDRIQWLQLRLANLEHIDATFSAGNLSPRPLELPPLPPEQLANIQLETQTAKQRVFMDAGMLKEDLEARHWRVTAFVSSMEELDYGEFLGTVRAATEVSLNSNKSETPTVQYTGIMPLVHEIQKELLKDLFQSFLGALVLITVVMTLAVGSFRAGLVSMIPNIFPILVAFGLLGWLGSPVDIGMVMTASMALGIAVDDTFHYLTFYQRALPRFSSRLNAVRYSYQHCGAAMVQSSVTCGLGLIIFAWSDFCPTSRFAWMSTGLIAIALIGDLVLLPALLLSPLGVWFGEPGQEDAEDEITSSTSSSKSDLVSRSPELIIGVDLPQPHALFKTQASTVSPGPKASIKQVDASADLPTSSKINRTVGEDIFPN